MLSNSSDIAIFHVSACAPVMALNDLGSLIILGSYVDLLLHMKFSSFFGLIICLPDLLKSDCEEEFA
jgi:hypothetical protein